MKEIAIFGFAARGEYTSISGPIQIQVPGDNGGLTEAYQETSDYAG